MSANPWSLFRGIYGSTGISALDEMLSVIPHLTHPTRKKLMTVCRARCYPQPFTVLHSQTWGAISNFISGSPERNLILKAVLESPMLSGFFLSALLSAPYTALDVQNIKNELMWKEVSVMESTPRLPQIDWMSILTYCGPLHTDLNPSPTTNRRVRIALRSWMLKCQRTILYPSMGNKAVSFDTRFKFENALNHSIVQDIDVTSSMVEHFYSRSGIKLRGCCEMKQKWYPTQASPRTYYAQGGEAYHTSKFLRDAINWLCDAFWPTNRFTRVSPSGIPVNLDDTDVFIYDLTSFTSLFHEHASFIQFLSQLTEEVDVTVFDSWHGPLTVSLGSLFNEYLQANVLQPSYSTRIHQLVDLELHHSIAGFLGVFGNLMTCTFPHGICLSTVQDNPDECWCAGDDAGTKEPLESSGRQTMTMSKLLGSVSIEKTFRISEPGAIALKRPIDVQGGLIYQHPSIIWPVFAILCEQDPRFYDPNARKPLDRITGSIVSFLNSCQRVPLSPSDIEFAYSFFVKFYHRYRLPLSGWYPPLTGHHPWSTTIARMDKACFGKDPLHVLIDSFYGTEYVSGLLDDIPWDACLPALGERFVCNSAQHLAYLVKLGYLSRELITCIYPGAEGLSRAKLDVDHPPTHRLVYEFSVVESVPDHLQPMSQIDEY